MPISFSDRMRRALMNVYSEQTAADRARANEAERDRAQGLRQAIDEIRLSTFALEPTRNYFVDEQITWFPSHALDTTSYTSTALTNTNYTNYTSAALTNTSNTTTQSIYEDIMRNAYSDLITDHKTRFDELVGKVQAALDAAKTGPTVVRLDFKDVNGRVSTMTARPRVAAAIVSDSWGGGMVVKGAYNIAAHFAQRMFRETKLREVEVSTSRFTPSEMVQVMPKVYREWGWSQRAKTLADQMRNRLADYCDPPTCYVRSSALAYTEYSYARYAKKVHGYFKELGQAIRDAIKGEVDEDDIKETIKELLNNIHEFGYTALTSRTLIASTKSGYSFSVCGCGHIECDDDAHTMANDRTACSDCYEDEDIVVHDVLDWRGRETGPYLRSDVYHWDRDDCYHTEPEPDDDDEDEDDGNLSNWGRDTTRSLDHDYSFDSSSQGEFIMGVELEVETIEYDRSSQVREANAYFNRDCVYAMFKRDGSLNDERGFEIVTAARKLEYHLEKFGQWKPNRNLRAWQQGNCGMHVHIDSQAFSPLTLGKFVTFINSDINEALIKNIAGRHPKSDSQARSYCASVDQHMLDLPSKALKSGHYSRYRMVNLVNLTEREAERLHVETTRDCKGSYSTVELRIFRASLKKERLLAQIEFTHAAIMFCRQASYANLSEVYFKEWLKVNGRRYKNLLRWYGITVVKAAPAAAAPATAEV